MTNDKPKPGNPDILDIGKDTRWQKGQSGNPAGRPPMALCITDKVRELLNKQAGAGKTNLDLVAEALIELAKDPNRRGFPPIIKELLDRVEGKVPDTHKIESDIPINLTFKLVKGE